MSTKEIDKPVKNILFSLSIEAKIYLSPYIYSLIKKNGRSLYATLGTRDYFQNNHNIRMVLVSKITQEKSEDFTDAVRMTDLIEKKVVDLIINIPSEQNNIKDEISDGELIRKLAAEMGIPIITSKEEASLFLHGLSI